MKVANPGRLGYITRKRVLGRMIDMWALKLVEVAKVPPLLNYFFLFPFSPF